MNDVMEEAQRLTPVRGGGSDGGLYPFILFFCTFPFLLAFSLVLLLVYLSTFIYISGDEG